MRYQVVNAHREQVAECHTPSRALFLLKTFIASWPGRHYEITVN